MLTNRKTQSRSNDWHDYYTKRALDSANISGDRPFVYIGMGLEPENAWNEESHKYDGPVTGLGVWVIQNDGEYKQNPIKVIVEANQIQGLTFGKTVKFDGLLGYFSRKNYSYSFRADGIKVVG